MAAVTHGADGLRYAAGATVEGEAVTPYSKRRGAATSAPEAFPFWQWYRMEWDAYGTPWRPRATKAAEVASALRSVEAQALGWRMTEDELLRALPLADRLRIAAVDLAVSGAPGAGRGGVAGSQKYWSRTSRHCRSLTSFRPS